ncbi:Trk system potassium transporter TrkA [uncultured Desulfosarcina sp.]|uniref:Trk system potassium transporter TrkA n=1 Tax=uncultured Desulfosarcina sp. TaxID=218289 RepID=UPI0029C83E38|nr:Trk system potassium transporter TrkA [uncultured Desulfosarcina sp.]
MLKKKKSFIENILILGLGGVGSYLAKRLVHEGYAVTAIEPDSSLIRYADSHLDARLIQGSALDIDCWRGAGAQGIDVLIAVTNNDAVNMLSAMIADRFHIPLKIARVRSLDFGGRDAILSNEDLKIDLIIHPEELAAQEIVRLVKRTAGIEIIDIADGQTQVMATRVTEGSPLAHKKLRNLSKTYNEFPFRVVGIARGITTILPGGDNEILPQDQVLIMASRQHLPRLMAITGEEQRRRHRVMILGGGLVGSRVADLMGKDVKVKIVEKDEARAAELCHRLSHAEVLHGDGSDAEALDLAGLTDMDTFITTTGENETNIMSCMLAKHLMTTSNGERHNTERKTISLVSKEEYLVLAATSGSDIALNKKVLAANEILKFIRRGELLSVAHLHGFDAEVVEIKAAKGSPITRIPLSKIDPSFHGKILIGGVYRDDQWKIAVGDTRILPEERVIVICKSMHLKDVHKLFLG